MGRGRLKYETEERYMLREEFWGRMNGFVEGKE